VLLKWRFRDPRSAGGLTLKSAPPSFRAFGNRDRRVRNDASFRHDRSQTVRRAAAALLA